MTGPRQILFLQGLPGRFFLELADTLRALGHGVHRVNFNGGDWAAWGMRGVNYRGAQGDWPAFLARLLMSREITDVVLFGDCRPMHRMARATSAGLGVAVHVFEEGYIRPDWITLERGGVNGFSPLPDDPAWYRRVAASLPAVEDRAALPEAFSRRAKATIAYYAAALLLAWAFPRGRTHRPWHPLMEGWGWLGRFTRRRAAALRSTAQLAGLQGSSYFVLPLQLDSDYQLRAHSDFDGMQAALARAVASFARHAPADVTLVVKEHPLDNGLNGWRRRTLAYARALGVEHRVMFLEIGDIGVLVRAARGVITVNSTTGTLALAAGVPVLTLGRAVYDLPGLTHQGPLDGFWSRPQPPSLDLYDAFRRVLANVCLLHGGFFDVDSRAALLAAAVRRILDPEPHPIAAAAAPMADPLAGVLTAVRPRPTRVARQLANRFSLPALSPLDTAVTASTTPIRL